MRYLIRTVNKGVNVYCCRWTAIAIVGVKHYDAHDSYVGLYADVKILLNTFQTLAVLEVI